MGDILGWIGATCFALCGVPQAIKAYREGHCRGLSVWFLMFWMLGEVFYISGTLLKFGWVGWMMFNYLFSVLCLSIIIYFKVKSR